MTGGPYGIIGSASGLSYTDSGLVNGAAYYYVVASSNVNGTGTTSVEATATPSAALPPAPTGLTATTGGGQVALSWNASAGATSYVVLRSGTSGGPYTVIASGVTVTSDSDTGVATGVTYYYVVAASNGSGTGAYSNQVSTALSAQSLTWTGTASSAWDFGTGNWTSGGAAALYTDGANVTFPDGAATGSVVISSTVSPGSVTFSNTSLAYTLNSSGGGIAGTTGLAETGAGTLTMNGSNNYSGTTTIASGAELVAGGNNALQNTTLDFSNGALSFAAATTAPVLGGLEGTNAAQSIALTSPAGPVALTVGGNNSSTTYTGSLSGAGSVTKAGTGTLTLGNANYTGNTIVNDAGTLGISGGSMGSSSSTIYVGPATAPASNAGPPVLNITGGTVAAVAMNVGEAGNETGASLLISGGTANFTTTLLGGNPAGGNAGNTGGSITITGGAVALGSAYIGRGQGGTAKGLVIDGAGAVVTATLLNVSSNAGVNHEADLNVQAGSLTIGNSSSTGAFEVGTAPTDGNNVIDVTGGTLTYAGADGVQLGSESYMTLAGGTANLSGITVNSSTGGNGVSELVMTGGTLYLGAAGLAVITPGATVFAQLGTGTLGASANWTSSAPITLTGNTTFQTADASGVAHNITLAGALSGGGGLTVTGGGTLTLAGHDTYTGATNIFSGILEITGSDSISSSLTVASGAVCYVAGGSLSISGGITNNGIFKTSGSASLSLTGAFINNGVLDLINGPQTLPPNFTNNGTVLTASSVQVQQLAINGSNFTLTVQGYAEHTYQLQRTTSLAAPVTWINVGPAQTGMGSPLTFTDTGATTPQGFYQVQVLP